MESQCVDPIRGIMDREEKEWHWILNLIGMVFVVYPATKDLIGLPYALAGAFILSAIILYILHVCYKKFVDR